MKTLAQHIGHARIQPHHVRRRVTFALAGGATALIALVWLSASLADGAFAIKGRTFAQDTGQTPAVVVGAPAGSGLQAAAAAASSPSAPAHIEIIDETSAPAAKADATVIPF